MAGIVTVEEYTNYTGTWYRVTGLRILRSGSLASNYSEATVTNLNAVANNDYYLKLI